MPAVDSLAGMEVAGAGVQGTGVGVCLDRRRRARPNHRRRIPIEITNQASFNDYISSLSFSTSDDYPPVHVSVGSLGFIYPYNHTPRVPTSDEVDLEIGEPEARVHSSENDGKQCRICHLNFEGGDDEDDEHNGDVMELGCNCKGDLATAHKKCALTWFLIKGDLNCEICSSFVRNVGGLAPNVDFERIDQAVNNEDDEIYPPESSIDEPFTEPENGGCMHERRFVNVLLGCMTFAFVISWLFHFNILH